MTQHCIHASISGRVQGVGYRAFTRKHALALGVTGWAKNLEDGRVEAILCGDASQLESLIKLLHQGPTLARVEHIEQQVLDWQSLAGFTIG